MAGHPALVMMLDEERTVTHPARAGREVCRSISRARRCPRTNAVASEIEVVAIDLKVVAERLDLVTSASDAVADAP